MINKSKLPQHIAIIMDGNRRWAKEKGLRTYEGHKKGISQVKEIIKAGQNMGIKVMTFYCFSTENWKRTKTEVKYLMTLFTNYIKNNLQELNKNNVKIKHIGRQDRIPKNLQRVLQEAEKISKKNTSMTVNLAIDYGGKDEIVRAINKYYNENSTPLTAEYLSKYLDTAPHSNVDLFIRTSGEKRISNFLLWEIAYAELFFIKEHFPDFSVALFTKIIENYVRRNRRYGN